MAELLEEFLALLGVQKRTNSTILSVICFANLLKAILFRQANIIRCINKTSNNKKIEKFFLPYLFFLSVKS